MRSRSPSSACRVARIDSPVRRAARRAAAEVEVGADLAAHDLVAVDRAVAADVHHVVDHHAAHVAARPAGTPAGARCRARRGGRWLPSAGHATGGRVAGARRVAAMTPPHGPVDRRARPPRPLLPGRRAAGRPAGGAPRRRRVRRRRCRPPGTPGLTAVSFATVADLAVLAPNRRRRPPRRAAPSSRARRWPATAASSAGLRALVEREQAPVATCGGRPRAARTRRGATAVLLTCEGGDFLEGHVERVAEVHAQGVSSLTLVHYRVNELGDIQTEAPVHGGLTDFGRTVVHECNRLGIVIDCAHATFATTLGVLEASAAPGDGVPQPPRPPRAARTRGCCPTTTRGRSRTRAGWWAPGRPA